MRLPTAKPIGKLSLLLMLNSCGTKIDVEDSDHRVETKSDVSIGDSEHTIKVESTLDKIMVVCGIILDDNTIIPYTQWDDTQHECLDKLGAGGSNGQGGRLQKTIKDQLGIKGD